MRVRCLKDVGGFDESMPAIQDWDCWLRVAQKYKVACVDDVLVKYNIEHTEKHISGNLGRQITGIKIVIKKNEYYLREHKDSNRNMLFCLANGYAKTGQYKNFFSTWFSGTLLMPLRVYSNLAELLKGITLLTIGNYSWLYFKLKHTKDRLKGVEFIDTNNRTSI
mgnify:CR=1 FL=1